MNHRQPAEEIATYHAKGWWSDVTLSDRIAELAATTPDAPAFIGLSAFVGAGLVFAGVTDTCGMGLLLARMPWNRVKEPDTTCCVVR